MGGCHASCGVLEKPGINSRLRTSQDHVGEPTDPDSDWSSTAPTSFRPGLRLPALGSPKLVASKIPDTAAGIPGPPQLTVDACRQKNWTMQVPMVSEPTSLSNILVSHPCIFDFSGVLHHSALSLPAFGDAASDVWVDAHSKLLLSSAVRSR